MKTLIIASTLLLSLNVFAGGTDTRPLITSIGSEDMFLSPRSQQQIVVVDADSARLPVTVISPKKPLSFTELKIWLAENTANEVLPEVSKPLPEISDDSSYLNVYPVPALDGDDDDGEGGVETIILGPRPSIKPELFMMEPHLNPAPLKGGTDTLYNTLKDPFAVQNSGGFLKVDAVRYIGETPQSVFVQFNGSPNVIKINAADLEKVQTLYRSVGDSYQKSSWISVK